MSWMLDGYRGSDRQQPLTSRDRCWGRGELGEPLRRRHGSDRGPDRQGGLWAAWAMPEMRRSGPRLMTSAAIEGAKRDCLSVQRALNSPRRHQGMGDVNGFLASAAGFPR